MQKKVYRKGEVILRQGETSNRLVVLGSGRLEIYRDEFVIDEVSAKGSIFGEMSLLLEEPHTATVKAATEVSVYEISDADDYLESRPALSLKLSRLLARRLKSITTQLVAIRAESEAGTKDNPEFVEIIQTAVESVLSPRIDKNDLGLDLYEVEILEEDFEEYSRKKSG